MTAPTEIRQRAIALVEKLPEETLFKAVDLLEALCIENGVVTLGEETLLQRIQRRLPTDDQTRLTYLRQRNETGEITEAEHQELLGYVDRVERQDAERAEALIQLARLRNVELKTLLNEFLPVYTKPNAL
ncbi:hypothetical protein [Brasilonema bromeliae]|uniref:Co-chaperone DjlA N-terminal domain-containing protein n=1 Tax=Brasilonema bromeliae SPC951 TaxID=385972 RepID=A0ABX1P704_9CYAN|nr:hypothetical protein [Brasilonema bromeliae]NMG20074.1 hypothetical protein [Brasilonema bromeliae SPC951]